MTSRTAETSVKVVHLASQLFPPLIFHNTFSRYSASNNAPIRSASAKFTKSHPIFAQIRRHPFILFGLPFVGIIIGSSFALQAFTQTRYDYQETKVKSVGKEEELGMKSGRRKIDLKEEYYVRFFFLFFFLCKGGIVNRVNRD